MSAALASGAQRMAAEARMESAKAMFTAAAKATLAGDLNASDLARDAWQAIANARAELKALDESEPSP